jgi:tight adherence protein D
MKNNMKKLTLMVLCSAIILSGCQNNSLKARKDEEQKIYILENTRNYGGLVEIYRDRLKQQDSEETRLKLANLYYVMGNYNSSIFYLKPIVNSSKLPKVALLYAKNLMNKANPNNDKEPATRESSQFESRKLTEKQQLLQARRYVEKAITLDKNDGEAYNVLGIIQVRLQQLDNAELSFNKARSLFYDDIKVLNNLGMIAILQKDYRKAYDYLIQLYSNGNRESVLINNLFFSVVKLGDYHLARKLCIEHKLSDMPDILINELKYAEPKDIVNVNFVEPSVEKIKADYYDDLIEGNKIKSVNETQVVIQNDPVSPVINNGANDDWSNAINLSPMRPLSAGNDKQNTLKSLQNNNTPKSQPYGVKPTVPTPKIQPPVSMPQKSRIIDMRVGEHRDYSRLVIEMSSKGRYSLQKVNDQYYTITIRDAALDSQLVKLITERINKSGRNFLFVKVNHEAGKGVIINLMTKNVINVKESYLAPQDNYKHCFVFDFFNR